MPETVIQDAGIPREGLRDAHGIIFAIEGINLTASVITLATLRQYAPALVSAIRRWRFGQEKGPVVLTVKGDGIDLKLNLPPNVSTQDLLLRLAPLLDED